MPSDFAYMTSAKNLKPIFERLRGAGTPPKFTLEFLKSLGFGSSSDRPVIGVLKALGFISSDGAPTERYNEYRNAAMSGHAVAAGLREGWADLFLADQTAHEKSSAQLTELFKSVSGKGSSVAQKMATTFKLLSELATWREDATQAGEHRGAVVDSEPAITEQQSPPRSARISLHHDIHLHLPSTSDVSVHTAIFRALKAEILE